MFFITAFMLFCAGAFIRYLIDIQSVQNTIKNKIIALAMIGLAGVIAVIGTIRYNKKNPVQTSVVCGTVKSIHEVHRRGNVYRTMWFDVDNQGKRYPISVPDNIPQVVIGAALYVEISGIGKTGLVNARIKRIAPDGQMN